MHFHEPLIQVLDSMGIHPSFKHVRIKTWTRRARDNAGHSEMLIAWSVAMEILLECRKYQSKEVQKFMKSDNDDRLNVKYFLSKSQRKRFINKRM